MSTPPADKPKKNDRRAVLDAMKAETKSADRRRNFLIVGVCGLIALAIVVAAAYGPLKSRSELRKWDDVALADIGAPASVCGEITTKPATGNQEHVDEGTALMITDSPPAFGAHYPVWEGMERKIYTASDRPPLGRLMHNLEHGYTILWYDETTAKNDAQMQILQGIARKQTGTKDLRLKFKAAPWLSSDGAPFPKGQHIAMTHWSVGGVGEGATGQQVGVFQYCSEVSGEALVSFMEKYPYFDSPEPDAV